MIGCNNCNTIQHKDTRYGPTLYDEDGSVRKPVMMEGKTRQSETTCKNYYISGSKAQSSIVFEGGPFTSKSFHKDDPDDNYHQIW